MQAIAREDEVLTWKTLYAGLPSLMIRQVVFGSIKFLAFERACDFFFIAAPFLRDSTSTALGVTIGMFQPRYIYLTIPSSSN